MKSLTLDADAVLERVLANPTPPWKPIRSREAAELLGIAPQNLSNWKLRGSGPPNVGRRRRGGNRIYYVPAEVAAWASGGRFAPWELNRDWLKGRGLEVHGEATEESTAFLADTFDLVMK